MKGLKTDPVPSQRIQQLAASFARLGTRPITNADPFRVRQMQDGIMHGITGCEELPFCLQPALSR
jgi:hypothetical protein